MARLAPILAALLLTPARLHAGDTTFGLGLSAWRTAGEVRDDRGQPIDRDGPSAIFSYQNFLFGDLAVEFDLEDFESGFAGRRYNALAPELYLVYGRRFYVAAGGGATFYQNALDPDTSNFGALRVGVDLALPHRLSLDFSAGYRINGFNADNGANEDLLLIGVLLRYHRRADAP